MENPEAVRREMIARVSRAAPTAGARVPRRMVAVILVVAAVAIAVVFGPRPGVGRGAEQCAAADQAAKRGEVEKARRAWLELWRLQGGQTGLAARLAWAHVQAGEIGPAALWVQRGELIEPRDPALRWVEERVREAGGLVGATAPRWPIRPLEWSALALVLGVAAGSIWSRRGFAIALIFLSIGSGLVYPIQGWVATRSGRAVMMATTPLEGSDVELEPGQLVTIRGREGSRVRVTAGRVIDGWVPASTVAAVAGGVNG